MKKSLLSLLAIALITGTLQAETLLIKTGKQITLENTTRNPLRVSFTSKNRQGLTVNKSIELPNKGSIPLTVKDPFKVQYAYGPYSETVPAVQVSNVQNNDRYIAKGSVHADQGTLTVDKQ